MDYQDDVDALNKKKIDSQLEKTQIIRILPELYLVLNRIELCREKTNEFICDDLIFFNETSVSKIALEKWQSLTDAFKDFAKLLRALVSSRIFTIQKERKGLLIEFIIKKIESIIAEKPQNKYEAFNIAQKLKEILNDTKIYISKIVGTYTYLIDK